jgi:hypothetical protein
MLPLGIYPLARILVLSKLFQWLPATLAMARARLNLLLQRPTLLLTGTLTKMLNHP